MIEKLLSPFKTKKDFAEFFFGRCKSLEDVEFAGTMYFLCIFCFQTLFVGWLAGFALSSAFGGSLLQSLVAAPIFGIVLTSLSLGGQFLFAKFLVDVLVIPQLTAELACIVFRNNIKDFLG